MGFRKRTNRQPKVKKEYERTGWKPAWKTAPDRILGAGEPRTSQPVSPRPYTSTE